MTPGQTLGMEPGMLVDLYRQRQRYDDEQHGVRRGRPAGAWQDA